ncbi:hypothetical protein KAU33_12195 [Candidatus Dependentiae bacterium]|nr:hypothetical protein [Candidatus Dependentiae bacterium]
MKDILVHSKLLYPIKLLYYSLRRLEKIIYYFFFKLGLAILFRNISIFFKKNFELFRLFLDKDYFDKFSNYQFTAILNNNSGDILTSIETLKQNIHFKKQNEWTLPQEGLKYYTGDCKTTVIVIGYYLAWLKIPFDIYTEFFLKQNPAGHAFLIFYFGNEFYFIDNNRGPDIIKMQDFNPSEYIRVISHVVS